MKRKDLTEGNISKHILTLAGPLILSNIFGTLFELVDAVFIGKLGSEALAGISMAGRILFFLATFAIGLSIGTVTLIAKSTGAKEYEYANKTASQSFLIGIFFASFLAIIGYLFSSKILYLLGAKENILLYGTSYLKILFLGIYTLFFLFLGSAVLRGTGDTKTPMKIMIFSFFLNIILDWILIFGKFGFNPMGVKGAAFATIISRGIGGMIFLYLLIKGDHNIHLKIKQFKPDFIIIKKILKIGFPASIQMFIRSTSAIVLIKFVSYFGTAVIASYEIGSRIFSLFLLPGLGFADPTATIIGQNLSAGKHKRAKKAAITGALFYLIILIFLSTFIFIFSENVICFFNNEKLVVETGSTFLKYIAIGSLFLSFGLVINRAFQASGDAVTPMIVTGISLYLFQIPLAYILSFTFNLKQTGIWIAYPFSSFLQAVLITILFFQEKWIKKIK